MTKDVTKLRFVQCVSLAEFNRLSPAGDVAVISILDEPKNLPSLSGWRAHWQGFFLDAEYDADYMAHWRWKEIEEAGWFTPRLARSLRAYLRSKAVKEARGLVIHCHGGGCAVAVGKFASRTFHVPLIASDQARPNETVLQLLENPDALGVLADSNLRVVQTLAKLWGAFRGLLRSSTD